MCGISGVVLKSGEKADRALIEEMTLQMTHRGPDAMGIYLHEEIALGHRRLKIIDLSDQANQPMFTPDGKVGVVFNGEIYNFLELKVELEKKGHVFRTQSDTEVILASFLEWKEAAFKKWNGMFALCVLDLREKEPATYLVRDRFGIKPLFFAFQSGRLAFASEIKPLLTLAWVQKNISHDALLSFLKHSHVSAPMSIFEDIQQVLPGVWMRFQSGKMSQETYWDPLELCEVSKQESESSLLLECEKVLKNVVSRQLISDVPVGCFLSGGVDSSLLVMAYHLLGKSQQLQTFSIGYHEKEFDETPYAQMVAKKFHTDHHELIVQPKDFFKLIPEIPKYFDQPFADPTLLSSLLLSQFARKNVTVVFSGDGGDELFFGYSQQRAIRYLSQFKYIPHSMRRIGMEAASEFASFVQAGPFKRMAQQSKKLAEILQFKNETEFFEYWIGTIGPMRMDRLEGLFMKPLKEKRSLYTELLENFSHLSIEDKITQMYFRTFLLDTVLAKTDRAGMAYGLEARVPFLDDEMVEFSAKVPMSLKATPRSSKYILRKLLAQKLGQTNLENDIAFRKKQGFSIPMREWLRGELKYLMDEYLSEEKIKKDGIFQPEKIKALIREHCDDRANHSHLLWSFISFQMWKERFAA